MTVTIVETRAITGGADTHADTHMAAALDPVGGLLGVQEFPATAAGYGRLLAWLGGFGAVCLAGIEGTGSYGAGLARHVSAAGIQVAGVDRSAGRTGAGQVSPTRSTPSAPPGPPSQAGPAARPRAATVPLRRSGLSWSPSAAPQENAPRPSTRPGP
jgi:transposase